MKFYSENYNFYIIHFYFNYIFVYIYWIYIFTFSQIVGHYFLHHLNYIIFIFYLTYCILCSLFSLLAHLLDCYQKFHFLRLSIKLLIMQSFLSHAVLLEDNCFIILCWFLPYINMIQPHIYICPLLPWLSILILGSLNTTTNIIDLLQSNYLL